jgi:hypothetical protein
MSEQQYLSPTPVKRPGFSLLARGLAGVNDFVSAEDKAVPGKKANALLSGLANLVGLPEAQSLMEKLAYGERLTTGKGQTLKPAENVVEGAMALSPLVSGMARGAAKVAGKIPLQRDFAPNALLPNPDSDDIYSAKTALSNKIGQRVGDLQTQIATRDWAFTSGAKLLSQSSGQTVTLGQKYMKNGEPVYFARFENPKTGDVYESTVKESFLTDPARFLPLDQQPADLGSVNRLLKGLAGK